MGSQFCSKCGEQFQEGSLKYIIRIKALADFDGHISCEDAAEAQDLEALIGQIEKSTAKALENDIHQEMAFLLCKDCRDDFMKNPLNRSREYEAKKGNFSGLLH